MSLELIHPSNPAEPSTGVGGPRPASARACSRSFPRGSTPGSSGPSRPGRPRTIATATRTSPGWPHWTRCSRRPTNSGSTMPAQFGGETEPCFFASEGDDSIAGRCGFRSDVAAASASVLRSIRERPGRGTFMPQYLIDVNHYPSRNSAGTGDCRAAAGRLSTPRPQGPIRGGYRDMKAAQASGQPLCVASRSIARWKGSTPAASGVGAGRRVFPDRRAPGSGAMGGGNTRATAPWHRRRIGDRGKSRGDATSCDYTRRVGGRAERADDGFGARAQRASDAISEACDRLTDASGALGSSGPGSSRRAGRWTGRTGAAG